MNTTTTTETRPRLSCDDYTCRREAKWVVRKRWTRGELSDPTTWELMCSQHKGGEVRSRKAGTSPIDPLAFRNIEELDRNPSSWPTIVGMLEQKREQRRADLAEQRKASEEAAVRRAQREAERYNEVVAEFVPAEPWVVTRITGEDSRQHGPRVFYVAHPVSEAPSQRSWNSSSYEVVPPFIDLWGKPHLAEIESTGRTMQDNPYAARAAAEALKQAADESIARWPGGIDPEWPTTRTPESFAESA